VDHILVDGRELVGEKGVESLDEFRIPFHDVLLRSGFFNRLMFENIFYSDRAAKASPVGRPPESPAA
jgi:hypothetical protein